MAVYGVSEADIAARAEYFLHRIEATVNSPALKDAGLIYHERVHDILAHVWTSHCLNHIKRLV